MAKRERKEEVLRSGELMKGRCFDGVEHVSVLASHHGQQDRASNVGFAPKNILPLQEIFLVHTGGDWGCPSLQGWGQV